jgi:hypothetical protein
MRKLILTAAIALLSTSSCYANLSLAPFDRSHPAIEQPKTLSADVRPVEVERSAETSRHRRKHWFLASADGDQSGQPSAGARLRAIAFYHAALRGECSAPVPLPPPIEESTTPFGNHSADDPPGVKPTSVLGGRAEDIARAECCSV